MSFAIRPKPLLLAGLLLVRLELGYLEAAVVLRVGLGSVPVPQFPELGRRFLVVSETEQELLRGPLVVTATPPLRAAQAGLFTQKDLAHALAVRLQALGLTVRQVQRKNKVQVLVTPLPHQTKEELQGFLKEHGYDAFWVILKAGVVTVKGGEGGKVSGKEVLIRPWEAQAVVVGNHRYRGHFLCLAGGNGPEVINVLPLEDYLLGVVPAEMGFNQLEALKAQAIAARTFALAHRGAHEQSGYHLCSREHCQVYRGLEVEKPLATRAVTETQGVVLTFQGHLAETYFHATCGGHTEAAENVFSSQQLPYLTGVPCQGEKVALGKGASGPSLHKGNLLQKVAVTIAAAMNAASPLAFARAVGEAWGESLEQALGLPDFSPLFPEGTGPEQLLRRFQFEAVEMPDPWVQVLRLAQLAGRVRAQEGIVVLEQGQVRWRSSNGGQERPVAGLTVIWQDGLTSWEGSGETRAGSKATLWCVGELCPVITVEVTREADSRSRWRTWVREFSVAELGALLGVDGLREIRILKRTTTGRVLAIEVVGLREIKVLSGAEFRRLTGLPSTWFVFSHRRGLSYRFYGKGWGHGVGLCQEGAYGLALGGWDFSRILAHYYPFTQVEKYRPEMEERQP